MKLFPIFKKNLPGITAIEALISIGIVSVVVMTVYSSLTGAMSNVNESKMRASALALANEKMEKIRNLTYDQIGTVEGIIDGPILQNEEVVKNNYTFTVATEIRYLDDATDGFFPSDLVNTDYKQTFIDVGWGNEGKKVSLSSIFVPDGVETSVGGGTLSINVMDSSGNPVPAVSIEIQSIDDNPTINYSTGTDDMGNVVLPGVPAQNYRIYLSKNDYEDVRTYPNPPASGFTPLDADLNIVENFLNTKTFFMDKAADLTLTALDFSTDEGIEGIDFHIKGGKKIGINPDAFNVDLTESTDSSGDASFLGISPGSYQIEDVESLGNSDYTYIGTEGSLPLDLSSDEEREIDFFFAAKDVDSLVVSIRDSITGERLTGASVQLTGENFDQTITTGEEGIAFFPQAPDIIASGEYSLSISMDGYSNYDDSIEITGLEKEDITLNQN